MDALTEVPYVVHGFSAQRTHGVRQFVVGLHLYLEEALDPVRQLQFVQHSYQVLAFFRTQTAARAHPFAFSTSIALGFCLFLKNTLEFLSKCEKISLAHPIKTKRLKTTRALWEILDYRKCIDIDLNCRSCSFCLIDGLKGRFLLHYKF